MTPEENRQMVALLAATSRVCFWKGFLAGVLVVAVNFAVLKAVGL